MTKEAHDQHANLPQKEKGTVEPPPTAPAQTNVPTGLTQRIRLRINKHMGSKPRPLVIASILILILVILFPVIYSLILLFNKPPATPFILAMVTSYSKETSQNLQGLEAFHGAQLYIDYVNLHGGVDGHPLKLQELNEGLSINDSKNREIANQAISKYSSLLVLGPVFSSMLQNSGANKIYNDAHVPLITASISYDSLTHDNSLAFRLRTPTSEQGQRSATYVRQILGFKTASIVRVTGKPGSNQAGDYGYDLDQAFTNTFQNQGGTVTHHLSTQSPNDIVSTLKSDPNPGIIFLAMTDLKQAIGVITTLRNNHITVPILCSDGIDSDLFAGPYPASITNGIYASAPIIYDSAPDQAQTFANQYKSAYPHSSLGWFGATYYEAAQVAVKALQDAKIQGTAASLTSDRESITRALMNINSPQTAVEGLDGPLYFDSSTHNEVISQTRFGQFYNKQLRSLPTQLVTVSNPNLVDLSGQIRAGQIIQVSNVVNKQVVKQYFWKQRVVYAGISLNSVSSIDVTAATCTVDFYFWIRYLGDDSASDVTFTNASNINFDASTPQVSQMVTDSTLPLNNQPGSGQRLHYRRYHIKGDLKAIYDFHQYPFDQQPLNIAFQNTHLTSNQLVYVIDWVGLGLQDGNATNNNAIGNNATDNTTNNQQTPSAFQSLSTWRYQSMQYASDTFSSNSTLGDPDLFGQQQAQTDYSGLKVTITVQRRALAYLISHLLPLILLIMLVYASLFLSLEHLGDRLTLTVSALLASAVLLLSVNSELPDIGYAVSLDYIYYIFFGLCLLCTVIPMFMEWLHLKKHTLAMRCLDIGLNFVYIGTVVAMVAYYVVTYGSRFS